MGYHRAGFEVVGVDIKPQPRYPFEFHQADALEYLAEHGHEFDAIHASPPCQAYSITKNIGNNKHPALIETTRIALEKTGKPFVIENVVGAPLHSPVELCGAVFGLKVYRHRLFESNVTLSQPNHRTHNDSTPRAGRGISPKGFISVAGHMGNTDYVRTAMGIDWMVGHELSQAVPPAYTEYLGFQLRAQMMMSSHE